MLFQILSDRDSLQFDLYLFWFTRACHFLTLIVERHCWHQLYSSLTPESLLIDLEFTLHDPAQVAPGEMDLAGFPRVRAHELAQLEVSRLFAV